MFPTDEAAAWDGEGKEKKKYHWFSEREYVICSICASHGVAG